jgi:hypothetical protein
MQELEHIGVERARLEGPRLEHIGLAEARIPQLACHPFVFVFAQIAAGPLLFQLGIEHPGVLRGGFLHWLREVRVCHLTGLWEGKVSHLDIAAPTHYGLLHASFATLLPPLGPERELLLFECQLYETHGM